MQVIPFQFRQYPARENRNPQYYRKPTVHEMGLRTLVNLEVAEFRTEDAIQGPRFMPVSCKVMFHFMSMLQDFLS